MMNEKVKSVYIFYFSFYVILVMHHEILVMYQMCDAIAFWIRSHWIYDYHFKISSVKKPMYYQS